MLRSFFSRLAATVSPQKSERRLNEEIDEHLEQLAACQTAKGTDPNDAWLAAKREFGAIEPMKEMYRDRVRFRTLEQLIRDIRFTVRQARKNPGFTLAAILSLALGIGANVALFSFVNALLLKPLPVPTPDRLALIRNTNEPAVLSYQQINRLNREATQINHLFGTYPVDVSVIFGDQPQWISAELVTGEYFHTLEVKPERGRLLTQADLDDAAGNPVCVISERLWRTRLRSAADVIGRTIQLNTRPYKIVGVTEPGFSGPDLQRPTDLQIPATRLPDYMPAFVSDPRFDWKTRLSFFSTMVRLRPDASLQSASAELSRLNKEFLKSQPGSKPADITLEEASGGFQSSTKLSRPASILLGVSMVVLLIACANLATLLLSRISARSTEFAVRLAIGGSRRRILAQMLVESSCLAVVGSACGVVLAYGIQRILLSFLNRTAPAIHQLNIRIDGSVLLFLAILSGACVVLFGMAPALEASRTAPLGSSTGNTSAGGRVRQAFVVAQIALSFVVVLAAGLLAGTLRNLKTLDLGYHPDQIAVVQIRPATGGYTGTRADQFYSRIVERVRSLPGVKAASTALGVNTAGAGKMRLDPQGSVTAARNVNVFAVSPGYFDTLGARILQGRDFDAADTRDSPQVYVINQHLASTYFGSQNPVGQYLRYGGHNFRVVGVVSDVRDQGLRDAMPDTVYQAAGQLLTSSLTVFVRCSGLCQPVLPTLRAAIRKVDPLTPILDLHTMQTELEGAFSAEEVLGFLSMLFAVLTLLLVAAGLYGILAYTLTQRTREIGLRVAIGASPKDIIGLFTRDIGIIVVLGTAIGVPLALAVVTLIQSQLFGIAPYDPVIVCASVTLILTTVLLASVVPIRRAMRIAPQEALRVT